MNGLAGSEAVRGRIEVGLEDRLQDVLHRCLHDPIFHSGDAQRTMLARLSRLGNEHATHRTRAERARAQFAAYRVDERVDSHAPNVPHRDPVYPRRPSPAIAGDSSQGDPQVAGVRDESPQLAEHVAGLIFASRVRAALHALEPGPVGLGCHIHGFPQRLRGRPHSLPPFAMCAAFPRPDYYGGSVLRPRRRWTWQLAGSW
jgi:hypothetical protein